MTNTIEATANSLKLSYLRFVSDSAPGLLLIVAFVIVDPKHLGFRVIPEDPAVRAVLAVAGVLLASPIGLLINGAGHFLLGSTHRWIDRKCFVARRWPVADTRQVLLVDAWQSFFQVCASDWPAVAQEVDEILETFVPQLAASLDHVRALKKLCRSIAFIAVVIAFIIAGVTGVIAALVIILGMAAGATLSGWTRYVVTVLVTGSFVGVAISCWKQSPQLTIALVLVVSGFLLLGGLVDFYQHALTMLFVYQLLVRDGAAASFKITPAQVRKRLALFVQSTRT